ncbi:MAG: LamG domain-containing protein, partial [Chloroflexaceae bacterium]|nr:LamG domain-containing protein [Chloroflexaceae bacterium]
AFASDANTIAIFSLDEGSGQTTADRSGNGYSLTLGLTAGPDGADPAWVTSTAPTSGGGAPVPTSTPTPTNTPAPSATSTPTSTVAPTSTPTPGGAPTSTPSSTSTAAPTITATPTSTPTSTPTATPAAGSNFALAFAGDNDQAQRGPIPGLGGAQTAELWVRPATNNQTSVIAGTSDGDNGWAIELENGRAVWWLFANGQWRVVTHPTVLAANTWYHVAVTYDATSGTARVFVNGVAGAPGTVGALVTGTTFSLGGLTDYPFFNGQLDEVRLSNVVRYTGSFTPPTTAFASDANTIAIFSLDEGSGQTTADRSGNGYSLTLGLTAGPDGADPAWVTSTVPIN